MSYSSPNSNTPTQNNGISENRPTFYRSRQSAS
uniref:Uncharacterized protein n=1 Tax=Anguilla anguilla TaxID=7936 RepID=A0A0E9P750_ANGAN